MYYLASDLHVDHVEQDGRYLIAEVSLPSPRHTLGDTIYLDMTPQDREQLGRQKWTTEALAAFIIDRDFRHLDINLMPL